MAAELTPMMRQYLAIKREDIRGAIARRAHMLTVKTLACRRPDNRHTIGHGFLEGGEFLTVMQNIRRMHRKALAFLPAVLQIRCRETKMMYSHISHRAAARADIAGIKCAYEHDANIVQRIHKLPSFFGPSQIMPSKITR